MKHIRILSLLLCLVMLLSVTAFASGEGVWTIVASDYSDATSTADTTDMFAPLNRQGAAESIVLLENRDGALPLDKGEAVTLIMAGSYRLSGGGSGASNASADAVITPQEGLDLDPDVTLAHFVDAANTGASGGPSGGSGEASEAETNEDAVYFSDFLESDALAKEYASDSTTAILWLSRYPGEGNNRYATAGDWYLSENEEKALALAKEYFDTVVVVLNLPSIDMAWVKEYDVDAVILYGYAGAQGGGALADLLTGKDNFSGKLAETLASLESYPAYENFETRALGVDYFTMTDGSLRHLAWWLDTPNPAYGYDNGNWIRPYDEYYFTKYEEGIYNGYRYFETFEPIVAAYNASVPGAEQTPFTVYYKFGYGLSYTDFDMEITDVTLPSAVPTASAPQEITLTVKVTNTGTTAGKDVVEVYCGAPDGVLENPSMELVAFAKTDVLQPGENQTLEITFDCYDLSDWYEDAAAYILMAGDYTIYVGNDIDEAKENAVVWTLDCRDYTVVAKGENLGGPDQPGGVYDQYLADFPEIALTELSKADYAETKPGADLGVLKNDTEIQDHVLGGSATRERFQAAMRNSDGSANYISPDSDYTYTEYYNHLYDQVIEAISDAQALYASEGKADIRLIDVYNGTATMDAFLDQWTDIELCAAVVGAGRVSQLFTGTTSDGKGVACGDGLQGNERLGVPAFSVSDGPNQIHGTTGATTTAWVCGNNRARTWNEPLMEQIGEATGYESLAVSTEILLGPAMCINRYPLCGRNYEYFSEDPVLTGVISAALIRGIQRSGVGVSPKHYACNQSEGENNDRWNKMDAIVSERALREIYTKGFEIVVKTSHPTSVMTGYNTVNGHYCAGNAELMGLLYEYGFDGISMTDWSGDWGNVLYDLTNGTEMLMPSNVYMLAYLYNALLISDGGRGLSYREAGGDFDVGMTIDRETLRLRVANILNTEMRMRVFFDYYGLEYTPEALPEAEFQVSIAK